ncbi:helix-turn-helix domain-containing protein [Microbacteriaceae bacterium VKM Ac-2854]|nr:helix-turn-helix domain-containing protein [Microbacteriaceae bacterium VKM Ac-2854]
MHKKHLNAGMQFDVALEMEAAIDWLADRGWAVDTWEGRFRIFADLVEIGPFALGRIWHSPADISLVVDERADDRRFVALLGAEGTHTVTTGSGTQTAGPGSVFLHDLTSPLTVSARVPAASIILVSSWDRLTTHRATLSAPSSVWEPDGDYFRVITSLANAVLSTELDLSRSAASAVARSVEALVSGLVLDRELATLKNASSAAADLLRRAIAEIDRSYTDPHFTIDDLTSRLGVSRTYLHQAFSTTGVTASQRVRHARAATARSLLADAPATAERELLRIANAAGFRSVRTMQRTLARGPQR